MHQAAVVVVTMSLLFAGFCLCFGELIRNANIAALCLQFNWGRSWTCRPTVIIINLSCTKEISH